MVAKILQYPDDLKL